MDEEGTREIYEALSPVQRERVDEQLRIGWPIEIAGLHSFVNWGMPSNRLFSAEAKIQLRELVSDSVISILEETSGVKELYSRPEDTNGKSKRKYLIRLRRALQRLESVLDDAPVDGIFELCGLFNRYREPPLKYPECVQKYIASHFEGDFGSELFQFRRDVGLVLQLTVRLQTNGTDVAFC